MASHGYALPSNGEFVMLLDAYRELGGLARAQEVTRMMASRGGPNGIGLNAMLRARDLLSFEWQSHIWIPLFQFDRSTMALLTGLTDVIVLLSSGLEPWEQALWFSQRNPWLGGQIPAQVLALDHEAVVRAACADELATAR
jgi:hypothetical protein